MREAMGVDRDALELIDLPLAQCAFDGGARLPAVQDDRLIIKNAPLVEHMGISSDRIGSPARVEPCRPEIARRLEAHHVGGRKQTAPPQGGDVNRLRISGSSALSMHTLGGYR